MNDRYSDQDMKSDTWNNKGESGWLELGLGTLVIPYVNVLY